MIRLTYPEFAEARQEFDAAVGLTAEIESFCSSSTWGMAAAEQLRNRQQPNQNSLIVRDDDHWIAFVERSPNFFQPFDSEWMFGSPLIGPDPETGVNLLHRITERFAGDRCGYLLGGIQREGAWHREIRRAGERAVRYQEFEGTSSMIIDLDDGVEAWLGRRTRKFRASLRAAERKAAAAGIEIVSGEGDGESLFQRILAIQKETRKWKDGTDIFLYEDCARFYRQILFDLRQSGRLRLLFARSEGQDVAHLFGGVFGNEFRGLQMSYREDVASLGLGNVLQLENLRRIQKENLGVYGLGMPSDYKVRWADREVSRIVCVLIL